MPERETIRRARKDAREGKAPTTQAGEFVREEIEHVREGKHGVRSSKQAIAIGLSKARKAGVKLPPPPKGSATAQKESRRHRSARRRSPSSKDSGKEVASDYTRSEEGRSLRGFPSSFISPCPEGCAAAKWLEPIASGSQSRPHSSVALQEIT